MYQQKNTQNFKQHSLKTDHLTEPPVHDLTLESEVLAIIIYFENMQYKILHLAASDFYSSAHQRIFEYCKDIYTKGEEISYITFPLELKDLKEYDTILESFKYILSSKLDADVKRLKKISALRAVQDLCYKVVVMCKEDRDMQEVQTALEVGRSIVQDKDNKLISIQEVSVEFDEYIKDEKNIHPVRSGFAKLDSKIGGFYPGTFNVIASAQGVGKTTMMLNMVTNMCLHQNKSILFVSLEMTRVALYTKLISVLSGYDFLDIILTRIPDNGWKKFLDARGDVYNYKLDFLGKGENKISNIQEHLKRNGGKYDLVCVDYLQATNPEDEAKRTQYETTTGVSKSFKALAVEFEIPFLVISSISRKYAERKDFKPQISDLRESGQIEYDADLILLLHRPSVFIEAKITDNEEEYKHLAELIIAKNRMGVSGLETEFYFDGASSLFKEEI